MSLIMSHATPAQRAISLVTVAGRRFRWSLACLLTVTPLAQAQTLFLDFNTVGQYTNNFNPWNDNGGGNGGNYCFSESAGVGAGASRGVSVFQSTDTTATYRTSGWDFSTNGATLILSALIKANGQTSGNKVQLGIINTNGNGLNNNGSVAFESYRFIPTSPTTWSLREQFRTNLALAEITLGDVPVVAGRWYKFQVALTNTSGPSGNYVAGCAIYDYGTDGLSPGANVVAFSTIQTHLAQAEIAGIPLVWPTLRGYQNAGIDAWDNFLLFTAGSKPVLTLGLVGTNVPAGAPASFKALAEGPGTISYSWYTNGTLVGGAAGSIYMTPPLNLSYTNVMVIAANANGSVTNSAAISVFVAALAGISNSPASNIQPTSATLGGQITSTGGDAPVVTLYYGPIDGGTNAAAWSNSISMGLQSGAFGTSVGGLVPGTSYFFAARAVNAAGTSWAQPALAFSTPPVGLATIANLAATNVQGTLATLNGRVLSSGGDVPRVILHYGPTDGGTNAGAWAQSVLLGSQSGFFAQTVTGLSLNTTYYFAARATNLAGAAWASPSLAFTTQGSNAPSSFVAVLTQHNDLNRTGANLQETLLSVANVNTNQFGLLVSRPVDDEIHTQPLIMTNVNILGKGTHNLVIVATVNDSIYAFDADDPSVVAPYWQTNFLSPGVVPPRNTDMTGACGGNYNDFAGRMGIVGTPVIDPATGTLYVVVRTKEGVSTFVQRLHALDVRTGSPRPNSPVVITASYPGTGVGNVGGVITFDSQRQNQRPALALVNGIVYITWASHCDWNPYHGWVIGYDAATLQRAVVYNNTPNGQMAGIWMSDQAPAADAAGNLYISTGNGSVGSAGNPQDTVNRGESFLKLTRAGTNFTVASWFTPYNWPSLESTDTDLGSGGVVLIPGTNLLFSGGKQGMMYLVNRDNMGGLTTSTTTDDNIVQSFLAAPSGSHQVHGGPAWWDGPDGSYAYLQVSADFLRQFKFDRATGKFLLPNFAQGPVSAPSGQPGGIVSLSANGTNAGSGVVWVCHQLVGNANQQTRPGIVRAYHAQNISSELWNSEQLPGRDSVGNFAKYVAPTVANGKVYVATFSNKLNVYGLLPSPALSISLSGPNVVIAWKTNTFLNYTLQTSSDLQPNNWVNASATPVPVAGGLQVTVPVSGSAAFYRLKR
jgi:hypothetical protein